MKHRKKRFGSKKFPKMSDWIVVIEENEDRVTVRDELYNKIYYLKKDAFNYLNAMDGSNTPLEAANKSGLELNKVSGYLGFFLENNLIRTGRSLAFGMLSLMGRHKINHAFAVVFNFILSFFFLPILILGTFLFFTERERSGATIYFSNAETIALIIFILIFSLAFHEFCHAVAAEKALDVGVMFRGFICAYVLVPEIKNRGQRIRCYAAGIKGHCLLAGISGLLSCLSPNMNILFENGYYYNLVLAFVNILPLGFMTDGYCLLFEFLKIDKFYNGAFSIFWLAGNRFMEREWRQAIVLTIVFLLNTLMLLVVLIGEGSAIIKWIF